jgi:dTDP-4-amino-4,6-dideoxy-D-galactose acyltransferase
MIIIDNSLDTSSLKERTSRQMLKIISSWNKDSIFITFTNTEKLIDQISKSHSKVIVSTFQLPKNVSVVLHGLKIVQIIIGRNDDLLDYADIFIDPLEPKSFQHFFGTNFLPANEFSSDLIKEISEYFQEEEEIFLANLSVNRANESLNEILSIFKLMEWDSEFFGINIGYVSCRRLTENIELYIREKSREMKIDMIQYNCNCHDQVSIFTAEKNNYSFVDVRVTFELMLQKTESLSHDHQDVVFRKAKEKDIAILSKIAGEIYILSRYYFDGNFDQEKVREFYEGWLEKGVRGEFDDYCFILELDNQPVAFTTVSISEDNTADIGIVGVNANYAGKSLGTILIQKVISELRDMKLKSLRVVTQGRNYPAQRLYQKSGFITSQMELWYHNWLR